MLTKGHQQTTLSVINATETPPTTKALQRTKPSIQKPGTLSTSEKQYYYGFHNSTTPQVSLAQPEGFDRSKHALLIAYVLPFYALETFTHWRLLKHKALFEEERKAAKEEEDHTQAEQDKIHNAVYCHASTFHW
ncbi:hypothetical protein EG329_004297 [Mollisiaceae sp. DMI_Dod_QoI]|nr:hypothetical protein EG329_004297 [Helotiales sp. DMI_Dod_QoI]